MIRAVLFSVLIALSASRAVAVSDPAQMCDAVADAAAREAGLPPAMLRALTRTETGRARSGRLTPWPWTVNMEGAGHWFDSRAAALQFVRKHHARGATSFDVGCFQINYRWHNQAFDSIEAMFDPLENARYAARFLLQLKEESGNWETAIGHYHSRTPSLSQKYVARYRRIKNTLKGREHDRALVAYVAPIPAAPATRAVTPVRPGAAPPVRPGPGAVSLLGFARGAGLLTRARPLFD